MKERFFSSPEERAWYAQEAELIANGQLTQTDEKRAIQLADSIWINGRLDAAVKKSPDCTAANRRLSIAKQGAKENIKMFRKLRQNIP